jgi:NitT/TauT family transport system ATP-binding protein
MPGDSATPILELRDVGMSYRTASGDVAAIDTVTASVERGEFISLVGPSGCGKSTLLKLVADLLTPTRGSISVAGLSPRKARLEGMFSFVFQNPVLLPWRTLLSNVRLPIEIVKRKGREPAEVLELVGLAGYESLYPHELSGGMQQRAAIARALTFDPEVLLMDEPFGAVDELTRGSLNTQLMQICDRVKVTVLFVTHSLAEAVYLSDRVLVLSKRPARIVTATTIPFGRPRDEMIRESHEFQEVVTCLREALAPQ